MSPVIDQNVEELWYQVVQACNKICHHAKFYGIQLMYLPDPNVHDIAKLLETVVIPLIDSLAEFDFSPESGMRMANIKTYSLHLKDITKAINEDDVNKFNASVDLLMSEAML